MKKGDLTKHKILDKGFEKASALGLECLTIGNLAQESGMSKSGLFSHFKSKENLQISVLEYAGDKFSREVIVPALAAPRGIPRVRQIMENWIRWTQDLPGGCLFVSVAAEYSDRPGRIQDLVRQQHDDWINCLERIAQSALAVGDFKPGTDCTLFAFQLYSLILGFFLYHNSMKDPHTMRLVMAAFDRLLESYIP